ncbi:hypothetical protein BJ165DRAFT_1596982 [Panaeolus papilionaceus]|nr:hypothetical protein BJ165DRAFT_1596982 [Panaeolus papilionaceus]
MLITLPTELILAVTYHVPSNQHKKLRFICHHMNDVLRPQLLSLVVFNVQCNNLDLSLLETLAREADLHHISNDSDPAPANCVAHLVRKLTIYALNPL